MSESKRLQQINDQIESLEKQIIQLKNEKNAIKLMKLCDITDDDLDRVGNFQVDLTYDCISSEPYEYSSLINGKMVVSYNYTNVHFKSATEIETKICTVKLTVTYGYYQTYENRYEPNIESSSKVEVDGIDERWQYIENQEIEYSDKNGKWGYIINKILVHIDEDDDHISDDWKSIMETINW
jgi:hypothetical protein